MQGEDLKTKVFVGDVAPNVTKEDILREFERVGRVDSVWVASNPGGFAFVHFIKSAEAERAVNELNGVELNGRRIRVELSHTPKPTLDERKDRAQRYMDARSTRRSRSRSPRPRSGEGRGDGRRPPPREPYAPRDPYWDPYRAPRDPYYPSSSYRDPYPSYPPPRYDSGYRDRPYREPSPPYYDRRPVDDYRRLPPERGAPGSYRDYQPPRDFHRSAARRSPVPSFRRSRSPPPYDRRRPRTPPTNGDQKRRRP